MEIKKGDFVEIKNGSIGVCTQELDTDNELMVTLDGGRSSQYRHQKNVKLASKLTFAQAIQAMDNGREVYRQKVESATYYKDGDAYKYNTQRQDENATFSHTHFNDKWFYVTEPEKVKVVIDGKEGYISKESAKELKEML